MCNNKVKDTKFCSEYCMKKRIVECDRYEN